MFRRHFLKFSPFLTEKQYFLSNGIVGVKKMVKKSIKLFEAKIYKSERKSFSFTGSLKDYPVPIYNDTKPSILNVDTLYTDFT